MRLILAVVLALLAGLAGAQQTCTVWTGPPIPSGQTYPSAAAACGAWLTYTSNANGGPGVSYTQESLTVNEGAGTYSCVLRRYYYFCDYGGSYPNCNTSNPSATQTSQVNGGGSGTSSQGACPSEGDCVQGTSGTHNFTIGWSTQSAMQARALSESAFAATLVAPPTMPSGNVCLDQCTVTVGSSSAFFHAYSPASNGLYRISGDYATTQTGQACTTPTESTDSNAPPLACPGYQGTVNGVPVCVPSTTQDTTVDKPYTIGNPGAGSPSSQSIGDRGNGGGNAGGPPSPRDGDIRGGGQVGTVNQAGEGESDGECGFGSNPPCKIDETGTPTETSGTFGQAGTDVDGAKDSWLGEIESAKATEAPGWTWTFALPTGCTSLTLPAFSEFMGSIDVCQFQPMFHDVISVLWVVGAIFGCLTLVGRTLGVD